MTLRRLDENGLKYLERMLLQAKGKKDPWTFIKEFIYTFDAHDADNPEKKFPSNCEKDKPSYRYLRYLVRVFQRTKRILVPKSRQVMISWLFLALCLWYALFHKSALVIIQKLKEKDAIKMLERVKFMFYRLPEEMKPKDVRDIEGRLEFPSLNSKIIAVSQDSDEVRGDTVSIIFSDEMSKQDHCADAYTSAKPTVEGGGWYIGVGTPNGEEFFYHLVHDIEAQWKDED